MSLSKLSLFVFEIELIEFEFGVLDLDSQICSLD